MSYNLVTLTEIEKMVALYASGLSSNAVGKRLGRDGRLVRKWLTHAGVLRKRTEAVRMATETRGHWELLDAWTPESAWVLGLLFGDGHLRKEGTGNTFFLAGSLQVCTAVAEILQLDAVPVDRGNYALLRWSSWRLADVVRQRFGIGGNKALTMRFPDVPADVRAHFVRGLWDADGCWTRRGNSLSSKYVTASQDFAEDLLSVLKADLGEFPYRLRAADTVLRGKTFRHWDLVLNVEGTRRLVDYLYEGSFISLRCARKYEQAAGWKGAQ